MGTCTVTSSELITALDARVVMNGYAPEEACSHIQKIIGEFNPETQEDWLNYRAPHIIQASYFQEKTSPTTILLATTEIRHGMFETYGILGAVIIKTPSEENPHDVIPFKYFREDIQNLNHIAVAPEERKNGIGTMLMFSAMSKTLELGKRYLGFWGSTNKQSPEMKFFYSFQERYGIPLTQECTQSRRFHLYLLDLQPQGKKLDLVALFASRAPLEE